MKNKQQVQESKILFNEFRNTFIKAYMDSGLVDEAQAILLVNKAQEITKTFLLCTSCSRVLPDEDFYPQKTCAARRGRSSVCATCWKEKYTKPKGFR